MERWPYPNPNPGINPLLRYYRLGQRNFFIIGESDCDDTSDTGFLLTVCVGVSSKVSGSSSYNLLWEKISDSCLVHLRKHLVFIFRSVTVNFSTSFGIWTQVCIWLEIRMSWPSCTRGLPRSAPWTTTRYVGMVRVSGAWIRLLYHPRYCRDFESSPIVSTLFSDPQWWDPLLFVIWQHPSICRVWACIREISYRKKTNTPGCGTL